MKRMSTLTRFEHIAVASIIALVADFGWVIRDMLENGIEVAYTLIALGLLSAIIYTAWILIGEIKERINGGK